MAVNPKGACTVATKETQNPHDCADEDLPSIDNANSLPARLDTSYLIQKGSTMELFGM